MKKRYFLIPFIVGFAVVLLLKKNKPSPAPVTQKKEWQTITKDLKTKKIAIKKADPQVLKTQKLDKEKDPPEEIKPKGIYIKDRLVLGLSQEEYEKKPEIEFINSVNPDWEKIYARELLRFHHDGTKALVKKERSLIQMTAGGALFVEVVRVRYLMPDGDWSGFRAMVNSQTGKLIRAWDRTRTENFGRTPTRLTQHTTRDTD